MDIAKEKQWQNDLWQGKRGLHALPMTSRTLGNPRHSCWDAGAELGRFPSGRRRLKSGWLRWQNMEADIGSPLTWSGKSPIGCVFTLLGERGTDRLYRAQRRGFSYKNECPRMLEPPPRQTSRSDIPSILHRGAAPRKNETGQYGLTLN